MLNKSFNIKCESCLYKKQACISSNNKRPVFSFANIQSSHGLKDCPDKDKIALLDKLSQLSQMTWQEIFQNDRHKTGQEKIPVKSIKEQVPPCVKADTNLIAIRYKGKAPMIGYRENEVFYILWIDYDYKVYKH